jgi:hypothetical protein
MPRHPPAKESAQPQWPADKVERRLIAELIPYARNAREHTEAQVAQIAASIREWGWTMPVLVDEAGALIAGHGRILAARQLGIETVPVITARGWSEAKIRAYRLADNKLALNASWDFALQRLELDDLRNLGFDLSLTGFSEMEIGQLFAPDTDPTAEWDGMPEYEYGRKAIRSIIMHFKTPEDVEDFARLMDQQITDQTRYLWHPAVEPETLNDKAYQAE